MGDSLYGTHPAQNQSNSLITIQHYSHYNFIDCTIQFPPLLSVFFSMNFFFHFLTRPTIIMAAGVSLSLTEKWCRIDPQLICRWSAFKGELNRNTFCQQLGCTVKCYKMAALKHVMFERFYPNDYISVL